jgi:hypothetical protein
VPIVVPVPVIAGRRMPLEQLLPALARTLI